MSNTTDAATPTIDHKPHAAFFRQSGWLMIANVTGGIMAWGVHFLAKRIPEAQYSAFGALLMVTACIPAMPLQMVFAQQTAKGLATGRERQLAGMIRLAAILTGGLWLAAAGAVFLFQGAIVQRWALPSATGLWVTLPLILIGLWGPLLGGVLQGRQDFFWMGWGGIIGGVGRFGVAAVLVLWFAGGATGMMFGALIGVGSGLLIAIWRTRDLWGMKSEPFDTRGLMKQVVPLMFGFGVCQFMFTSDTMFAKAYFPADEMASYVAAGTLSRALLWLVLPLAAVMFPKLVHASAKSEKSNLHAVVLIGTAVLALCGVAGLSLLGPWVVKLAYNSNYVEATTALLPWYAGAMVPLALANVLVNNLLARSQFRIVPWMVVVVVAYASTLVYVGRHFGGNGTRGLIAVLQTLTAFNILLAAVSAWFTFRSPESRVSGQ